MSLSEVVELGAVVYSEDSPTGLVWNISTFIPNTQTFRLVKGCKAGHDYKSRYYVVGYNNKRYMAHRVVWELCNGVIPDGLVIDHINGNGRDNRIENLRLVTMRGNARNSRMRSNNKTGFNGVAITERTDKNGNVYTYYTALWKGLNGEQHTKNYSIAKLGDSTAFLLAFTHRQQEIFELQQQGAGYTERHGK